MSRDFRKLENGTKIILNAYFIPYVNICLHKTADATSATPRQNKNANPLHIVVPPSPTPFSFIHFRSVPVRLVSFDRLGTRPSAPVAWGVLRLLCRGQLTDSDWGLPRVKRQIRWIYPF